MNYTMVSTLWCQPLFGEFCCLTLVAMISAALIRWRIGLHYGARTVVPTLMIIVDGNALQYVE